MFFKPAFLFALLLASAVLANGHWHKHRRSLSLNRIEQRGDASSNASVGYAGADFSSKNVYKVDTMFTVPILHGHNGGIAVAAFGLDVGTCDNALMVGFAFDQTGNGPNGDTYYAAALFQNDTTNAQLFNKLSFDAGDKVTITVTATSAKSGTLTIENTTRHKSQSITLKTQSPVPLCMSSVGMGIVATTNSQSEWEPLPNFGTLTFENTELVTSSGVLKLADSPSHDILRYDMELPKGKSEVVVVKTSISHGDIVFEQQN